MEEAKFNKNKILYTNKLDLNLMKKLVECYLWSLAVYGAETWTLRKVDQKYLRQFGNVVLEEYGDPLDRSCEKCRGIT
jgi:hypothetical protein